MPLDRKRIGEGEQQNKIKFEKPDIIKLKLEASSLNSLLFYSF